MSDAAKVSEIDAIHQVIVDGGAMDYVDIVNAVKKRYQLTVSSALVEQVHHDLLTKQSEISHSEKTRVRPGSRVSLNMTSNLPEETGRQTKEPSKNQTADDLGHALDFVKSVGGLSNAKRLLGELESILLGRQ